MPKHDYWSPKAISNREKSKGLQKLRWWCEACQKQCRDENGFKCHQTSEAHLRQMRVFADNPGLAMARYSEDFESNFLGLVSRRFGTKRVAATRAYAEYIGDKQHVHMNSTKWTTLTTFVKYLGKAGHCLVDETEKGWFVQWIDKDPAAMARRAAENDKRRRDQDDEDRARRELKRRVRAAAAEETTQEGGHPDVLEEGASLFRGAGRPLLTTTTSNVKKKTPPEAKKQLDSVFFDAAAASSTEPPSSSKMTSSSSSSGRMIDKLMTKATPTTTEKMPPATSSWLLEGIVVKVVNKELAGGAYYKKKGAVLRLATPYAAVLRMLESGDEVQLDQDDLETVIPNTGKAVALLRGDYRGQLATVLDVDVANFAVRLKILPDQKDAGRVLDRVDYEDISKQHHQSAPA